MSSVTMRVFKERKDLIQPLIDSGIFNETQIQIILYLSECVAIEYTKEFLDKMILDALKEGAKE